MHIGGGCRRQVPQELRSLPVLRLDPLPRKQLEIQYGYTHLYFECTNSLFLPCQKPPMFHSNTVAKPFTILHS